jgi:hypothetical protein
VGSVADFGACVVLWNVDVPSKAGGAVRLCQTLFTAFEAQFTCVVGQVAEVFLRAC